LRAKFCGVLRSAAAPEREILPKSQKIKPIKALRLGSARLARPLLRKSSDAEQSSDKDASGVIVG
jgi:hypothetical protein